ncbi:hypothetical protein BHQ23_16570 [Mycobacterium gordonae]|uniref:Terminase small subunit n=1 Tax=Mycobacterium gordonae TaxID=1778 RepID=A0A1X1W1F8_MYCGO|nr:hypothetical protein BHQ23_16570 [Mycobacterium gordonae]ORV79987.1 hypothetical protein AWC08_30455 [Mycobacterium gordonae]PJE23242.1 MAG: hypothetical protein CK431_12270 [Mycobacterium sp.]
MAKHRTLNGAMSAGDALAEAEIRYRLLAETFEEMPQLRANLNPALERAKAEIMRLRVSKQTSAESTRDGKVVPFDASRFQKSGT